MIAFRSCLISSIHVRCGLPLGRLTFLRYSASASLAGVSGCSLMRWPSQLRRRLCIVVLHSSVLVLVHTRNTQNGLVGVACVNPLHKKISPPAGRQGHLLISKRRPLSRLVAQEP